MKKCLMTVITLFSAMMTSIVFAGGYSIIVDAGSTGSRLHLFQYDTNKNIPVIQDVLSVKDKDQPGLSAFANNPEAAGLSLKKGLDEAFQKIKDKAIEPKEVKISILATAGMRLLPEDVQNKIYASVSSYIKQNYSFTVDYIGTISGKMEAVYGWLDVNYLQNHFEGDQATIGSIDMGGASTQIAFETRDTSEPDDIISFKVGGKGYTVFAKSFLGLGIDQARDQVNTSVSSTSCYPTGYKPTGSFNSVTCGELYADLIKKYNVSSRILPLDKNQKIVAYSGAYHTYNFLEATQTPDQANFEKRIQNVCTQSWDEIKKHYPQPEKYISTYCANAVYLDNLFYNTYQIRNQLSVANKINDSEIDWTLGALLYNLIK